MLLRKAPARLEPAAPLPVRAELGESFADIVVGGDVVLGVEDRSTGVGAHSGTCGRTRFASRSRHMGTGLILVGSGHIRELQ